VALMSASNWRQQSNCVIGYRSQTIAKRMMCAVGFAARRP